MVNIYLYRTFEASCILGLYHKSIYFAEELRYFLIGISFFNWYDMSDSIFLPEFVSICIRYFKALRYTSGYPVPYPIDYFSFGLYFYLFSLDYFGGYFGYLLSDSLGLSCYFVSSLVNYLGISLKSLGYLLSLGFDFFF